MPPFGTRPARRVGNPLHTEPPARSVARLRPLRHPPQPLRRARSPRGSLAPPLASPPPGARIGPSRQKVQHSHARAFGAATGRTAAVIARLTPSMPSACRTMPPKKRKVQGKLSGGRPKKTELYQRLEADVDLEEEAEIRRLEAGPAAAEIDALFAGVCLCLCRLRPCRHLLPAALSPSVSAFSRASDLDSCSAGASSSGGGPIAAAAATAATAVVGTVTRTVRGLGLQYRHRIVLTTRTVGGKAKRIP